MISFHSVARLPLIALLCTFALSVLLMGCVQHTQYEDMSVVEVKNSDVALNAPKSQFKEMKLVFQAAEHEKNIEDFIHPIPTIKKLPAYRLQVGDILQIRFLLSSEFDEEVVVRPDGMISTLIAQDIQAYGLTAMELQRSLVDLYKEELSDPHIAVVVRSFSPMRISVLGEVESPGELVSVDPNISLLQSIARAGGIKASANTNRIIVLRRGPEGNGLVFEANYKDAVNGSDPAQNMRLTSHDVVIVPRSDIANVYHYYRQFFQQFLPSSLGIGYELN